jgi:hypothetical protein
VQEARLFGSSTVANGFSNIQPVSSDLQNSETCGRKTNTKPSVPAYQLNPMYAELIAKKIKEAVKVVTDVMLK